MKKLTLHVLLLAIMATGCGGGTKYLKAEEDEGSREWGPKEIKMTVNKMVGSIYDYLKNDWKQPAFIQVKKFSNKTSEHIDTKLISDEIAYNLIKKRIKFIEDTLTADAIKEMEMGMSGLIDPDSAVPIGQLKSPNLYLSGTIRDNVRTVGGRVKQYIVVTMFLKNLRTRTVEWQERQEFLKSTKKNKISF